MGADRRANGKIPRGKGGADLILDLIKQVEQVRAKPRSGCQRTGAGAPQRIRQPKPDEIVAPVIAPRHRRPTALREAIPMSRRAGAEAQLRLRGGDRGLSQRSSGFRTTCSQLAI